MNQVDVSKRSYAIAEKHHYTPTYFKNKIAKKIVGAADVSWQDAPAQQSCAMRMSIALAYAGVHWPVVMRSWRLMGTSVYFPSYAGDYPDLLKDSRAIQNASDVLGEKGVIYFGGEFSGASGHVTLWNGVQCHHDDAYWDQPLKYFWTMAD